MCRLRVLKVTIPGNIVPGRVFKNHREILEKIMRKNTDNEENLEEKNKNCAKNTDKSGKTTDMTERENC